MSRTIKFMRVISGKLLLIVVLLYVSVADAEIRRWVDKDGKVHYSDKAAEKASSEVVTINDKYTIPVVERQNPLRYAHEKPNRPISIASIVLDMPRSESSDIRVGRISCGSRPVDLYWTRGVLDLQDPQLGNAIADVFERSGYYTEVAVGSTPVGGSLVLTAKLRNLKMNLCSRNSQATYTSFNNLSKFTKNATFVEVSWTLTDPVLNKTLYESVTKGSHDALNQSFVEDGLSKSFNQAMVVSAANLLADPAFVDLIRPENLAEMKQLFDEALDVEFSFGNRTSNFHRLVNKLKDNSVTVKTQKGHGSGVLINSKGAILTNAHVVGDESSFDVLIGRDKFRAHLVRKEVVRDVALIKIDNYFGKLNGVEVAKNPPQIGDEVFVVGTPLKIEFQHTVTKGILSATRNVSGLPYFQTDAAINPGNSGGPVFDGSGELVALTVAGMFTNGGASLNINYLIPIDDVIKTLKITENTEDNSIIGRIGSSLDLLVDQGANKSKANSVVQKTSQMQEEKDNTDRNASLQSVDNVSTSKNTSDITSQEKLIADENEPPSLLQMIAKWLDKPILKLF